MCKLTLVKRKISHQKTKDFDTLLEGEYNHKTRNYKRRIVQNAMKNIQCENKKELMEF